MSKIWIIVPAYAEAERIGIVLDELSKLPYQILVVDDGSPDQTFEVAKARSTVTLRHKINLGKGAAMKTGCEAALRLGAEYLVVIDADGQHRPEDVIRFVNRLEAGDEVVFGKRDFNRGMPMMMALGNQALSSLVNIFFKIKIADTQNGFRAFTALAYQKIKWQAARYDVETEMVVNAGRARLKYSEVNIPTIYLDNYKGTTLFDGFKILFKIIKWKIIKR